MTHPDRRAPLTVAALARLAVQAGHADDPAVPITDYAGALGDNAGTLHWALGAWPAATTPGPSRTSGAPRTPR